MNNATTDFLPLLNQFDETVESNDQLFRQYSISLSNAIFGMLTKDQQQEVVDQMKKDIAMIGKLSTLNLPVDR